MSSGLTKQPGCLTNSTRYKARTSTATQRNKTSSISRMRTTTPKCHHIGHRRLRVVAQRCDTATTRNSDSEQWGHQTCHSGEKAGPQTASVATRRMSRKPWGYCGCEEGPLTKLTANHGNITAWIKCRHYASGNTSSNLSRCRCPKTQEVLACNFL